MFIDIFACVWFSVISVISIPANILVITIIHLKNDCLDYYHLLLMIQCFRDILFNVLVNFYTVASLSNGKIIFGENQCRLSAYFSRAWYFGTALTLSAITIERFTSIKDCLSHDERITRKRLFFVIFGLIVMPILGGLPMVLGITKFLCLTTIYGCKNKKTGLDINDTEVQLLGFGILTMFLILPMFSIFRTSSKMIILVRRHKRTIQLCIPGEIAPGNDSETQIQTNDAKHKLAVYIQKTRDINIAKNVLIINAGFLLSLLPVLVLKFYARIWDKTLESTPKVLWLLVYWLNYCCAIWNPAINGLRRKDFRSVLKKIFKNPKTRNSKHTFPCRVENFQMNGRGPQFYAVNEAVSQSPDTANI